MMIGSNLEGSLSFRWRRSDEWCEVLMSTFHLRETSGTTPHPQTAPLPVNKRIKKKKKRFYRQRGGSVAILILMRRFPGFKVVLPTSRSSNVLFDNVSPTCKVSSVIALENELRPCLQTFLALRSSVFCPSEPWLDAFVYRNAGKVYGTFSCQDWKTEYTEYSFRFVS